MTPERWQRLKMLFGAAEKLSPSEYAAFLDEACADDAEMREQIEALLQNYAQSDDFLDKPALGLLKMKCTSEASPAEPFSPECSETFVSSLEPAVEILPEDSVRGVVDLSGHKVGRYQVIARLGIGGMGIVYKARDELLGRWAAVKVLPPAKMADHERKLRFVQEARAASALNHPNIVTIYEIGQGHDGAPYIVMECIDGQPLRQTMAGVVLDLKSALAILVQVAEGLSTAHEHGIVHRDLKPENIMVDKKGLVKILDFGLAKLAAAVGGSDDPTLSAQASPNTQLGTIVGTLNYMSPEQASGKTVDFRSDQFSLGVLMYEMLTSKRPFERATPMKSLAAVICEEPGSVVELNPQVPSPLRWILERCLAKSPDSRYGSTRELACDLALVRDHFSEAPVKMRRTPPAALPEPLTPLVGREAEIGSLRDLFRQGARLVTLTGTGGSGKTRLALEIARELDNEFPGGVYFLTLAAVTDPELVISTIAQAFGVWPEPGKPTAQSVREQLGCSLESRTLLVLDNFEQVVEAAPFIGELLTSSGRLNVLVTSREPLHIYGEQEFPVPPLAVPDCGSPPSLERISEYPAIVLFTQRAKAAKRNFVLTNENVMAIAQLCARLDGLPLAIELAAPGMKLFTPAVLLARLEDPLYVVARASSDVPVRHQTLRRAIEWSYNLLKADEQKLFRRLSVFVNGCTLEAAEAVCAAYEDLGIDLFEGLASLIDKSLVQQSEQAGAEARFVMLETIRAHAVEQLRASGEEAAILRAHAAYCLLLAEDGSKELVATVPDASWLTRFDLEHSNFQKAMEWLAEAGNAEWGMRLGVALTRFWELREYFAEGRAHITRILELPAARVRSKTRARALFAAGFFATAPDIHIAQKTETLDIYRELGDKQGMLVALNALGVVYCAQGNYAAARTRFDESLSIAKELGDRFALSHSLSNLGNAIGLAGEVSLARSLFKQSMDLFLELGNCAGVASSLDHLGDLARTERDYSAAESLYEEATSLFRGIGDRWGVAHSLKSLGNAARDRGDYAKAEFFYKESLKMFRELRRTLSMAQVLEAFVCCTAEHKSTCALTLAGAAAALRRTVGTPLPVQEKLLLEAALESARQKTGHRLAASCWNEGWAMLPDAAIDYALGI